MGDTRVAKDKLVQDMNVVIADAQQLLSAAAADGNEKVRAMRGELQKSLDTAKARLAEVQGRVDARAQGAAAAADASVQGNPWQSIASAAGVGALVGACVAMESIRGKKEYPPDEGVERREIHHPQEEVSHPDAG